MSDEKDFKLELIEWDILNFLIRRKRPCMVETIWINIKRKMLMADVQSWVVTLAMRGLIRNVSELPELPHYVVTVEGFNAWDNAIPF